MQPGRKLAIGMLLVIVAFALWHVYVQRLALDYHKAKSALHPAEPPTKI